MKDSKNPMIYMVVLALLALLVCVPFELWRYGAYKRLTKSDISLLEFVFLGDKLRIVQ